jgi:hypothetical protein
LPGREHVAGLDDHRPHPGLQGSNVSKLEPCCFDWQKDADFGHRPAEAPIVLPKGSARAGDSQWKNGHTGLDCQTECAVLEWQQLRGL